MLKKTHSLTHLEGSGFQAGGIEVNESLEQVAAVRRLLDERVTVPGIRCGCISCLIVGQAGTMSLLQEGTANCDEESPSSIFDSIWRDSLASLGLTSLV